MRTSRLARKLLGVALLVASTAVVGGAAAAQPVAVVDGDTLRVGSERVRLWGIDAPEAGTPEGNAASAHLRGLLDGLPPGGLVCERMYLDRHGRTVARCLRPDGIDLACEMVRAGHARDWPRYSGEHYRGCEG